MMAMTRGDGETTIIRVEGTFDRLAAVRLASRLDELPSAAPLVIDFSQVDSFHDVGVAAVAKEMADHNRLIVRGLGRHHLRLLRYCGVEIAVARPDVDRDEERIDG
jgi:hypothetical protein